MEKKWFILINGRKEGPYRVSQLRRDSRVTPDTLVWRQGLPHWMPIRKVPELEAVFIEDKPLHPGLLTGKQVFKKSKDKEEIALDLQKDPPPLLLWILLVIFVLIYITYKLYYP